MNRIRVLLVDDSAAFRGAATLFLSAIERVDIVGTAGSGAEALQSAERLRPDLVLTDLAMPGMNGLEATRRIKATAQAPRVIIMSLHDSDESRDASRLWGADAFISKSDFVTQLPGVIEELFPAPGVAPVRARKGIAMNTNTVKQIGPRAEAPATQDKLLRLKKLYEALSRTNEAVIRIPERDRLFREICDIVVTYSDFMLAAVRLIEPRTLILETVVQSGEDDGYLQSARVTVDPDTPEGQGPTGIALREGRHIVCNDYATEPSLRPWWAHAARAGIRSCATFPLRVEGKVIGGFSLYAREKNLFDEELVGWLLRTTENISFALENFEREAKRQRAEDMVRASEQRFRSLTELSSDWFWEQDTELKFVEVSGATPLIGGISSGVHVGKTRWELPDSTPLNTTWDEHKAVLAARQPFHDLLLRRTGSDGRAHIISSSGMPIFDQHGEFAGYRGIGKDVTQSKRAEQMVQLEHSVTRCLADSDNGPATLKAVIRAICESEGWETGRYWRVYEADGVLRFGDYWSVPNIGMEEFIALAREVVFPPGVGLVGKVWQSGQPLWVSDTSTDTRVLRTELARATGMRGAFVFPIMTEGRTLGVLSFSTREIREPDERLLQAVQVIGSQIGQFLQRKQAEEVLQQSEERFRGLTELSSDWYWEQDENLRFTMVSGNEKVKGAPPAAEQVGKTRWELAGDDLSKEAWAEHNAQLEARLPFRDLEYTRTRPDGTTIDLSISGEPVFDAAGRFTGYRGVGKDITKRVVAEEELRRFRAAMDMSGDAIVLVDRLSMRYVDVNQTACEMLGYTRQEMLAMTPMDTAKSSRETMERAYDAIIADKNCSASKVDSHYHRKDGTLIPIEARRRALHTDDGWIIVATASDISERKQADAALRESQQQFRQLADNIPETFWISDVKTRRILYVSPAFEKVWGEMMRGAEPDRHVWRKAIHAEDREHALAAFKQATDRGYDTEYRIVRKDGSIRWVHDRAFPVLDENGVVYRVAGVLEDVTGNMETAQRLQHLAHYDSLTNLPNRVLFRDRLEQSLALAQRRQWVNGVLFVDLDRFKLINDTLGHAIGDELLQQVSARLAGCVRSGDTVGRLGGDEFGVILSDLHEPQDAGMIAKKMLLALDQPYQLAGREMYMTASIGITLYPSDAEEPGDLIRNADAAMYRAKEQGRNCCEFYTPQLNDRALSRLSLESDLRHALERNEFVLHFQPKANLQNGELSGMEALLRWDHPQRGLVPPVEFISVLEETGMIVPVGEWVLHAACRQIKAWQGAGLNPPHVAVNLSSRQFKRETLVKSVERILADTGIDPCLLQLEITESFLVSNPDEAALILRELRALGIHLSVDDFGTGYSSLSYLQRFPLDSLKIDHSFIRDITSNPDDASITLAIINMAHSLKLKVVGEGVETAEQLSFLRLHGCDELQGYYYSRPLPAEACAAFLARRPRLDIGDAVGADRMTALVVDDDCDALALFSDVMRRDGFKVRTADSARAGFEILAKHPVGMVVSDQRMPEMSGVEFLSRVKQLYPNTVRVMLSGANDSDTLTGAINDAAVQKFLSKDLDHVQLQLALREVARSAGIEISGAPASSDTGQRKS